ncbi:MAG: GlsB/YeaQ/YmgE family stress response membrane protein [Polyangiaceae bacterium]
MPLSSLLVLLLVAGVCGGLGASIAGYSHSGCLGSIALGFVGAWVGMWIARELHLPEGVMWHVGNQAFPVVWSIVGSAVFVAVLSLLTRQRSVL